VSRSARQYAIDSSLTRHPRKSGHTSSADRTFGIRIGVDCPSQSDGFALQQGKTHVQARPSPRRRGIGGHCEMHCQTIEHSEEAEQPGEPSVGRPEQKENRIGRVALRAAGKPWGCA